MAERKHVGGKALMDLEAQSPKKILTFGEAPATPVPEYRTTAVPESKATADIKTSNDSFTPVPQYRSTAVPEYRNSIVPEARFYKKANEASDQLDRHLTAAESKVFDQLLRLTVGHHKDERQVRISVLQQRTGYGSDKTIRMALAGLELKGVIARIGRPNNPGGDIYRILSYSGTAVPEYRSNSGKIYRSTAVEFTGELKTDLKEQTTDDEAFAGFVSSFKEAILELTGREVSPAERTRFDELAEVLLTELRIAAGRTTVSSVPAFLAEHLRRRLWKKEKRQLESEGVGGRPAPTEKVDASACPDCFGTGMWYPEGFDQGVARCQHDKLTKGAESDG